MPSKCKLEDEDDNCSPDSEGDYCLYHKSDKNKEESEEELFTEDSIE